MEDFKKVLIEEAERHIEVCNTLIVIFRQNLFCAKNEDVKKVYLDVISRNEIEILSWENFKYKLENY